MTGAPITVLNVQIGGYDPNGGYWSLPSIFDSGGNHGTLPAVIRHGPDNRLRPAGHGYLNLNT